MSEMLVSHQKRSAFMWETSLGLEIFTFISIFIFSFQTQAFNENFL
jgi:hypothetical protein